MVVALQASKAARILRQRRGEVLCEGLEKVRRKEGKGEGWTYGLGAEALMTALRSENKVRGVFSPLASAVCSFCSCAREVDRFFLSFRLLWQMMGTPFSEDFLEEVNRLALRDLQAHGEVVTYEDGYARAFLLHLLPHLC